MKSWIRTLSLFGLSALTLASLSACETGEDRTMASAQSCLDGARDESSAQRCVDLVQGLETQDAYLVRCSAAFIANGFSGQKIADAYLTLSDDDNGGTDPMVSLMAYLNFDSSNQNFTPASAVTNCQRAGLRSMLQLATAANLATSIQAIASQPINYIDGNGDPQTLPGITFTGDSVADMQAAVDWFDTNGAALETATDAPLEQIGNIAIVANSAFCTGLANPNEDVCTNLGNAISTGNGDVTTIAQNLMNLLKDTP